jgi:thiosulfate/3-mercaptopyruvate sulfurtransferase
MSDIRFPLLVEADSLAADLGAEDVLVVDLSKASTHSQLHIPGAVFLDYAQIVATRPPIGGLLPDAEQLSRVFSAIGLGPDRHIVAYDDEGGGKAARLLWTLEAIGYRNYSLLNGGLHAWANEGHAATPEPTPVRPTATRVVMPADPEPVATREFILAHLNDPAVALIDARSPQEYTGERRFAARGGHIPGAVNLEWTQTMDTTRHLRLRDPAELRPVLHALGVTPDKTVVAYCQTHHRSAHTWFMLKWLGYRALGYAGSWSDWGNRDDTPVAEGP